MTARLPYTPFCSWRKPKALTWLVQELGKQLVDFDPFVYDRNLLTFVHQDLETYLVFRQKLEEAHEVCGILMSPDVNSHEELEAFLKIWIAQWLKWRERVGLFQRGQSFPRRYIEVVRKAEKIYRGMQEMWELRRFAVRKLN